MSARPVSRHGQSQFGPIGLQPEARGHLECALFAVALFAVALFAVALFAVALFAVALFAVALFAVVFFAVVFFAVDFFAVDFRAAGFAGVLFAVVLVPLLFVGMAASLVTLTLGSTCLGDHRRRGYSVGDRGRSRSRRPRRPCFGLLLFLAQVARKFRAWSLRRFPQGGVTPVTLRATYMENPDART